MSEKAMELARRFDRGDLNSGQVADLIDAAVAPLVEALEELINGATDNDHLVLVHVPSVSKALAPWRK